MNSLYIVFVVEVYFEVEECEYVIDVFGDCLYLVVLLGLYLRVYVVDDWNVMSF